MNENKEFKLEALVEPLCLWYEKEKRSMPWRDDVTPYHVWLSEIMLQQTRIEAAKAYYDRFTKCLPDIPSLAAVSEEELLKLWEGLGYYNRARNLKKAASLLVERYDGRLPADYDLLLSLPGIGRYTAGAIASIAYGLAEPAVDGNVLRVTMRYLNCDEDIMKMSVRTRMEKELRTIMPKDCPGEFNQALMELGEVICIPNGKPLCEKCPLSHLCLAHKEGREMELPKKAEKKKRIVVLREGHRAGVEPAVDNFGHAVHLAAALRALYCNSVDIGAVQLNIVRAVRGRTHQVRLRCRHFGRKHFRLALCGGRKLANYAGRGEKGQKARYNQQYICARVGFAQCRARGTQRYRRHRYRGPETAFCRCGSGHSKRH